MLGDGVMIWTNLPVCRENGFCLEGMMGECQQHSLMQGLGQRLY